MTAAFWLGPTYEFTHGEWSLIVGIPAGGGRLEWVLSREVDGEQALSHSFVLDPGAAREDLESALADVPAQVSEDLVDQVCAQTDPRLVANGNETGLA